MGSLTTTILVTIGGVITAMSQTYLQIQTQVKNYTFPTWQEVAEAIAIEIISDVPKYLIGGLVCWLLAKCLIVLESGLKWLKSTKKK